MIKIKYLWLSEKTEVSREAGSCHLKFDLFKRNSATNAYDSIRQYELSLIDFAGDVTGSHGVRIHTSFMYAFVDLLWFEHTGSIIHHNTYSSFPLKRGVYANMQELKFNAPSITSGFIIEDAKAGIPKFHLLDSATGEKIKDKVVGFSDGKKIYVSAKLYSSENAFMPVHFADKYLYFEDKMASNDPSVGVAFGLIGMALSIKTRGMVMDYYTGKVYQLDSFMTMRLLASDKELQTRFQEDPADDRETMRDYIEEFNKKH